MRIVLFLFMFFICNSAFAISYEYETKVCAEVTVLDKTTHNCVGIAEFKETRPGKFAMVVGFKAGDFEIGDTKSKTSYEKNLKSNPQKDMVFHTPEFSADEWSLKLKGVFHLINAELYIGEDKVTLIDTMLIKKKAGEDITYQIEAVVPLKKATFINLPKGLKGARTFHLTLIIPQSEIKGIKF